MTCDKKAKKYELKDLSEAELSKKSENDLTFMRLIFHVSFDFAFFNFRANPQVESKIIG